MNAENRHDSTRRRFFRVAGYLRLLPSAIRRRFRRPAQPLGTDCPNGLPLHGSWELMNLLPARMPKFQRDDRHWGIGDWELR